MGMCEWTVTWERVRDIGQQLRMRWGVGVTWGACVIHAIAGLSECGDEVTWERV